MDKYQAYHQFWNSFGIPAYDENTVPDDADMPYITYEQAVSDLDRPVLLSASIWYRSMSWQDIVLKAEEIRGSIGYGGTTVRFDGGMFWVRRGSPFANRLSEPTDPEVRRIMLQTEVEYLTA